MLDSDIFISFLIVVFSIFISLRLRKSLHLNLYRVIFTLVWHTGFCLFYWYYSQSNEADSTVYYENAIAGNYYDWTPGTRFVESFTKVLADGLQLSQFNIFLIYNLFGLVGLLILSNILLVEFPARRYANLMLAKIVPFLPGLSFWTSAIGKDSPAFFSVTLFAFSILYFKKRKWLLPTSILVMFLVRPHIGLIMILSLFITVLSSKTLDFKWRIISFIVAIPVLLYSFSFVVQYAGFDNSVSVEGASEYVQSRQDSNLDGGSSVDISSMSLSVKLMTYLFRPFFFDAPSFLWLIVSFENLVLVAFVLSAIYRFPNVPWKEPSFAVRLHAIYFSLTILLLANTTANLGIAIRQKTMFLPSIFILGAMATHQLSKKKRKSKRHLA